MRIQLLSDLHLETEAFEPSPAPGADLLVLAGDIDAGHDGLDRFAGWPVPVVYIAGNHEYDQRDIDSATAALRERCDRLGFTMLERDSQVMSVRGRRYRLLGTTLWCDFDLLGTTERERCMRAGAYFLERVQCSTRDGQPFGAAAVREEFMRCREWLAGQLARGRRGAQWDETIVITHFAPSPRSADPRYGLQPASASFCSDCEDLMGRAALWIHGHLHCRHDYLAGGTRVVCNARGHVERGEADGHEPLCVFEI
ncbi:MAG: metallophosphoesterase [Burkholderiales bacterium]|nr:metallophosphoesterase [Burkholderiales bacterium]